MNLFPNKKYRITIYSESIKIEERIKNELERNYKKNSSFFNSYNDIFIGNVQNGKFNLRRKGYGNTSIIPNVYGKIQSDANENQSIVEVIVTSCILVKSFLIIWYGILFLLFLGILIQSLRIQEFNISLLIFPIFFFGGYGIVYIGFSIELTDKGIIYEINDQTRINVC